MLPLYWNSRYLQVREKITKPQKYIKNFSKNPKTSIKSAKSLLKRRTAFGTTVRVSQAADSGCKPCLSVNYFMFLASLNLKAISLSIK